MGGKRGHGTLRLQLRGSHGAVLFFQLSSALSLLPLDPLALLQREHLFVFDSQLASLKLKMVQNFNHGGGLFGRREVGESQTTENAIVEVVVEGVGKWQVHIRHQLNQLLLFHGKRNIFDDNGGWNQLIVGFLAAGRRWHLRARERPRTKTTERTGKTGLLVEPCLIVRSVHLLELTSQDTSR